MTTLDVRNWLRRAALALVLLGPATRAAAQDSTASPWTAATALGALQTSGSTSSTNLTFEQDAAYAGKRWQHTLQVTASYASNSYQSADSDAAGNVTGTSTRVAHLRQWMAQLSTHRTLTSNTYWIGRGVLERDDNQAILRRFFAATGVGANLVAKAGRSLQLELAAGPIDELDADSTHQRYAALSGLTSFATQLGGRGANLAGRGEALMNLRIPSDIIFRGNLSLAAPLTTKISLTLAYQVTLDTNPNVGIFDADGTDDVVTNPERRNGSLTAALTLSW